MDNTLKQQIDNWTETGNHDKTIQALESLAAAEKDLETSGLLARAYNYTGEYEKALQLLDSTEEQGAENLDWNFRKGYSLYYLKRYKEALAYFKKANQLAPEDEDVLDGIRYCHSKLPFKQRVEDFWQWFAVNEAELSRQIEKRNEGNTERIIELVSKGTALLSEDVHFNLGGNYEFTFSIEGHADLFYLYPYLVSRLPEQFKDKWHFFPSNPGTDSSFALSMYSMQIDMANVRVAAVYREEQNDFSLSFYEKELCALPQEQSYNAYYIMMEIILGEGLSYQYIADVKRADAVTEDMITLPQLRKHIVDTLTAHGQQVYDNPQQVYTSYKFTPQDNEELRYDVVTGSTCFEPLIALYYQDSPALFDHINRFGAQAMFLAFPYDNGQEGDARKILDFRHELEDRLEAELLKPEELGLLLGGAFGEECCYIDLLLFDEPTFMEKIIPFLERYPQYRFYLSQFRLHGDLIRLT